MPDSTATTLPKQYRPDEHEPRIWDRWVQAKAFEADPKRVLNGEAKPYCILMPPPNVTAALHLGHALNGTIQDILIRAHRMKGFEALWMPGADHAGIATQTVVDKRLRSEGKPALADYKKKELAGENGREQFIDLVLAWKDEYSETIKRQSEAMGCGADWRRYRFTMDDICARAVREAFFRLFRDGLIYRGKRLVNWDPVTQTALADDEVENEEIDGAFYYLRYPLVHQTEPGNHSPVTWGELATRGYPGAENHPGDEQAWITVATTRPETYLGDTAVAVNPKDPRAKAVRGFRCELPIVGRVIPIVEDDYVVLPVRYGGEEGDAKAEMSTGFLKVTPAHDPNDEQLGKRHDLEVINVMAPDASISDQHGWEDVGDAQMFIGKSREDARKLVIEEFKARSVAEGVEGSLFERIVPHRHTVGHSYRSHVPIEPYLSDQWYCKVTDDRLRGSAQRALVPEQRTEASLADWPESTPSPRGTGVPPVTPPAPPSTSIPQALTTHTRNLPHWQLGGQTYHVTFRVKSGELSPEERALVLDACFHFQDERHITGIATVMPDHVHLILTPLKRDDEWWPLQEIIHSIKSYTAHEIQKRRVASGPLWQDEYHDRIIRDAREYDETLRYVQNNPVEARLAEKPGLYPYTRREEERGGGDHGRDARATRAGSSDADGAMRFYPERYAKTYETWHDNLRDWCISRQLWWGHRIPVWQTSTAFIRTGNRGEQPDSGTSGKQLDKNIAFYKELEQLEVDGRVHVEGRIDPSSPSVDLEEGMVFVCVRDPEDSDAIALLESNTFIQDPDVLDTWFSSALWPHSTMGWPDPATAGSLDPDAPDDTADLLQAFNPTSVLTTAREIITLWVSRMVMFNRYFLSPDPRGTGVPPG